MNILKTYILKVKNKNKNHIASSNPFFVIDVKQL